MRKMFMFPSAMVAVSAAMFWPGQTELGTVAHAGKWGPSTTVHFGYIVPALPAGAPADGDYYPVRNKESIQRTFDLGASGRANSGSTRRRCVGALRSGSTTTAMASSTCC